MKGGTRTREGETLPPLPVNRAWVAIGVSSPAPPGCCSGEVLVGVGVGVGFFFLGAGWPGAVVDGVGVVVVVVTLGGGALAAVVPLLPPPPPHPASASSPMSSAVLNRMALTRLQDHDVAAL